MNERIKELAEQAGFTSFEALDERNKKFAELIVKECLDIVKENKQSLPKNAGEWRDWEYGHWDASVSIEYDIKNKFGVER